MPLAMFCCLSGGGDTMMLLITMVRCSKQEEAKIDETKCSKEPIEAINFALVDIIEDPTIIITAGCFFDYSDQE